MTAQKQPKTGVGVWQAEPVLAGTPPTKAMRSWLLESGLLTVRLKEQCGDAFRLQLVNETNSPDSSGVAADIYRQVALCCGDEPCIYAESRIPLETANAHFWLRDLGQEPLGERLQSKDNVTRSPFAYTILTTDVLPGWIRDFLADNEQDIHTRRSRFFVGEHELEVTEYFLPGVVNCGNAGS
jgi:chorismate-pyruvate lyase